MDQQLQDNLRNNFPRLYPFRAGAPFEFDCGDGWYNALVLLSLAITRESKHVSCFTVCEKHGDLRYLVDTPAPEVSLRQAQRVHDMITYFLDHAIQGVDA